MSEPAFNPVSACTVISPPPFSSFSNHSSFSPMSEDGAGDRDQYALAGSLAANPDQALLTSKTMAPTMILLNDILHLLSRQSRTP
jgi:hypothetical protein